MLLYRKVFIKIYILGGGNKIMKSKSFFNEIEKWSNIKKILFIPVLMAVLCLVGYLMLVLVYCIPEDTMKANMQESANIFEKEGSYPYIAISNYDVSQLDNFTDSLMLLTASNLKNESVWKAAVHTSNCLVDEYNPCQTLIYLYKENVTDANLITRPYSRYWHGYLIFLKPLLCLFNYQTLRYIMMLVQTGLFTLLVIKLAEKNKALIIPVFFTWIFLNPVTIMMSLQFNSVFMVTFTAMLIIAYRNEKWKDKPLYIWGVFFLIIGAFTSYLDLLTYPLVTLGLPILLWFSLNYSGNLKENLKKIVCISAFWTTGYGVMWASKWILGSIITRENILKDAKDSIQFRTSSNFNEQSFNFVDVISNQFKSSNNIIWICLILVFLFVLVKRIKKQMFNILVPCLFIAVYPFVWYAVLKNHSFIHSFFTYRELAITLYAVLAFIAVYRAGGDA